MSLNRRSKDIRNKAFKLSMANGGYHYGGSFSCAEILINLYDSILQDSDRFILSKGHGCWVYYALLIEKGYSPRLDGHPHYDPANGVWCTTGSMGHGLPVGIGLALAKSLKGEVGNVYVLLGDGECQEGTTWESLLIAARLKLGNLCAIIDYNSIQGSGRCDSILDAISPLKRAAESSGWLLKEIDGHAHDLVSLCKDQRDKPLLVVATTIKGKGVSFMEDNPSWHARYPSQDDLRKALEELK